MEKLFPLPAYAFLTIATKNGGLSAKGLKNVLIWVLKTVLFEPLRWVELATQRKKVVQHTLTQDPVFILGFYRSGTSYLHHFLTQDERFAYHSNFQMIFPEIMLCAERWLSPAFDSIFRLFKLQDPIHRVPLTLQFPGEEDGTMTMSLNPRGAAWGYFFPKKLNDYFRDYVLFENRPESEIEAWKRDYVFLLKKISLASQGKQLVLKSPPNTARIKHLLALFPNAKFIFIHRNPYEVYASNQRFLNTTQQLYAVGGTRSVDNNSVILDTYAQTIDRYLLEKHLIPQGQLIELPYEDFVKEPLANMRKIYQALHLNDFGFCEKKMAAFAERQKKFVALDHQLPVAEKSLVSGKLERIIRYWNYPFL